MRKLNSSEYVSDIPGGISAGPRYSVSVLRYGRRIRGAVTVQVQDERVQSQPLVKPRNVGNDRNDDGTVNLESTEVLS